MDAPPAQPVRQHARIERVVFLNAYPGPDGKLFPAVEVPGSQIQHLEYFGGNMLVVELLPDGRRRQWFNVPCVIEHEAPSGLVLPTRGG